MPTPTFVPSACSCGQRGQQTRTSYVSCGLHGAAPRRGQQGRGAAAAAGGRCTAAKLLSPLPLLPALSTAQSVARCRWAVAPPRATLGGVQHVQDVHQHRLAAQTALPSPIIVPVGPGVQLHPGQEGRSLPMDVGAGAAGRRRSFTTATTPPCRGPPGRRLLALSCPLRPPPGGGRRGIRAPYGDANDTWRDRPLAFPPEEPRPTSYPFSGGPLTGIKSSETKEGHALREGRAVGYSGRREIYDP